MTQLKSRTPKSRGKLATQDCRLEGSGWCEGTRRKLERLIQSGAGKGLPVAFDFDNTLVEGDVGEATLARLVRVGLLSKARLKARVEICPSFNVPGRGKVSMDRCVDATEYYEALMGSTVHGDKDKTPLASGYVWAVVAMAGLRVSEVVGATAEAYACQGTDGAAGFVEATPGKTGYISPRFRPEMVHLLGELLRLGYSVWIVSASNVWSVRWIVSHVLNPMLHAGWGRRLDLRQVVGVSTLLADSKGQWYKDSILAQEERGYLELNPGTTKKLRLTSRLEFPTPTYSGKVAALFDRLGTNPYLAAGDSPGDLPMLAVSQHRLWVARLDKPGYQKEARRVCRETGGGNWLIQFAIKSRGLAPDGEGADEKARESLKFLKEMRASETRDGFKLRISGKSKSVGRTST